MRAIVSIPDVQQFVQDPAHLGELGGEVDYAPIAEAIPTTHGVFRLFAPTDDPTLTHMIYEVALLHEGTPYYLAGRKHVRDDPGFDLWADTTTLFTRLHEGEDDRGTVVGAGVLRLSLGQLFRMLTTFRTPGAQGLGQSLRAVARFGWFFAAALGKTYVGSKFRPGPHV